MKGRLVALLLSCGLFALATYCRTAGDCIAYFLAGHSFYWFFVVRPGEDR